MLQEQGKMKTPSVDEKLAKEYNADFDSVAFAVNQILLNVPDFMGIIHKEVGKCFDGDYNVLISQLIVNYNLVEKWFDKYNVDIRSIVEKYPLIQIAVPVEYEKWDGQKGLPVVFVPYEFDEGKTEFVAGYDVDGKKMSISTLEDPEFPVVVISENESTKVLDKLPTEPEAPQNLTATTDAKEGIMLEWEQYSDEDLIGYDIYRKAGSDEYFVQIASLVTSKSDKNTYSFLDDNAFGENYQYYVVGSSNHNTGDYTVIRGDLYTLKKDIMELIFSSTVLLGTVLVLTKNHYLRTQYLNVYSRSLKIHSEELSNGETLLEALARSRYLLFKYPDDWTLSQFNRARALFEKFPEIKKVYDRCCEFRDWMKKENVGRNIRSHKEDLQIWMQAVESDDIDEMLNFKSLIERNLTPVLNYFRFGATNAIAENINSRIQRFIMINQGTRDREFFYFRVAKYFS